MRIEFLADDNPLYVLPFFKEFLEHYVSEFGVTHISLCRPMGKRPRVKLLKQLTALYGPIGIIRLLSRFATARAFGLIPRRPNAKRFYTLAQLCKAYGISCDKITNPNATTFVEAVAKRGSDLLISVACPYILKSRLLNTPRLGCINAHHASLPKYRGMMPTFWQMFHGETTVGITIHYMSEAIDEGYGLLQEELSIQPGETLDHLIRRSKLQAAHCIVRVLRDIECESQKTFTLECSEGSYFTFPTIEQVREFRRRGCRAI